MFDRQVHVSFIGNFRIRLGKFVDGPKFQAVVMITIALNAITLGLETSSAIRAAWGPWLQLLDRAFLGFFTLEILMAVTALGGRFFRDPWRVFDFAVVSVALMPASGAFSILRAFRVLRVLRLVSVVPSMRIVVSGLLSAIPGLSSIFAILGLIFYVAAVMATNLFGANFPEWFGSIPKSMYTLFQVMTLESWSMGIVRPVMEVYPKAWLFFVPFIVISTFTMLNLFIGVIVSAIQAHATGSNAKPVDTPEAHSPETELLLFELRSLRHEVGQLRRIAAHLEEFDASGPERISSERPSASGQV
jgi:voltage-gated sodium channel